MKKIIARLYESNYYKSCIIDLYFPLQINFIFIGKLCHDVLKSQIFYGIIYSNPILTSYFEIK